MTREEQHYRVAAATANDAFAALMTNAIKKGKERPHVGIKVDLSPFTGRVIRGEPPYSGCGSPAASCVSRGDPGVGDIAEVNYA